MVMLASPGMGGHRHHVVARDVGRTRPAAREAGVGFQRVAVRIPDRADLQGQLHRDRHGGDLRVSLAQPARHRPGQRDRDRDHDGGEGRDLSGVRADARRGRGVLAGRLSAGGHRLLCRHRRQHAVVPVQRLDADPLLQQGPVPRRRPRSRSAAEDLAGGRRRRQAAARVRRGLRLHHVVAVMDQCREFFGVPQPADRHHGQWLRRPRCRAHFQQSGDGAPYRAAGGMADDQGVRL